MQTITARFRPALTTVLTLTLVMLGGPWIASQVVQAQEYQLFLSVTDANGAPVTDLDEDEIVVQWDGEDADIRSMDPLGWPVQLTILVDNSEGASDGIEDIREGLKAMLAVILQDVEIGILTLAGEAEWAQDHTDNRGDLISTIDELDNESSASAFLDGLAVEAERLADDRDEYFPVIVIVSGDGPDGSEGEQENFDEAMQRLTETAATVHTRVLSHGNEGTRQEQVGTYAAEFTRGTYETSDIPENFRASLPALGETIAQKHALVTSQHLVTYRPPDNVSAQPGISVGSTREGLNLLPTIDGNVP